jgi:cyclic pyranopterin phosphate synthase
MSCLDSLARPINYLRVSVTDRCNLRCVYCMPAEGVPHKFLHAEILTYEEIARVVEAAAGLGISKIRLTGGEPLARLGLSELVRLIAAVPGVDDIALTTNGILLPRYAEELKRAGLQRVNISLDTLQPERFRRITRRGELADVLAGIAAAERAGLRPLKLNCVVMRGVNDDEVADFARLTLEHDWHVRFIEVMPVGATAGAALIEHVPLAAMRKQIEQAVGRLEPAEKTMQGNGPARYYRLAGAIGTVGFIGAVSEHFCFGCNRLRLTADGKLRPCLLSEREIDVRATLRRGATREELEALLRQAIAEKPAGHRLAAGEIPADRQMAEIGG